jgi:uncharacterized protein (UPF0261 family)/REP element-mobilizing transposase RayT
MSVYLLATLDTKGHEAAFVRQRLAALGVEVRLVDVGCLGEPQVAADISRADVFAAAGTSHAAMVEKSDRGSAVTAAAEGAAALVAEASARGEVSGVLALGGSAGTTIGTTAMRRLPLGVPKLMVSTLASGDVRQWVGDKDILMLNSVVDILGINRISRMVLGEAAAAMAGMVQHRLEAATDEGKPLIAATMFGVTTPCVERAKEVLEEAGYEVLVFHATGSGGQAMESLIAEGLFVGVLDITTTELADELVGGVLSAGPERLTAAAKAGVPQVVSVGATDMVNFGAPDSVPEKFKDRKFYRHNPTVTLMRTTESECAAIGRDIRDKLERSTGQIAVLLPRQGVSAIDRAGEPFDDANARQALFDEVKRIDSAEVIELDCHINDPEFAEAAARVLIDKVEAASRRFPTRAEPGAASRRMAHPSSVTLAPEGLWTNVTDQSEPPKTRRDPACTLVGFFDPAQPVADLKGNLPHWRQEGVTYFVTFRLADSIPQETLLLWRREQKDWLARHVEPHSEAQKLEYFRLFVERFHGWLDAGGGTCRIRDEPVRRIVTTALQHFDGDRYALVDWVVMPNHVHVLVSPLADHSLSDILHSWKSFTAKKINKHLGREGQFWQKESFDHIVRNADQCERIIRYIRENPKDLAIGTFSLKAK